MNGFRPAVSLGNFNERFEEPATYLTFGNPANRNYHSYTHRETLKTANTSTQMVARELHTELHDPATTLDLSSSGRASSIVHEEK